MKLAKEIVNGKTNLSEDEISHLLSKVRDNYEVAPNVVRIPANHVYFVGDLHGDLNAANYVRDLFMQSNVSMVFLGDYVDRGPTQIETVNLVFAMSLHYPTRVTVLRGNHETRRTSSKYGFSSEVKKKHSVSLYDDYCQTFKELPIAGMSKNGIFCCHGGVPENLTSLEQLQAVDRHTEDLDSSIMDQLLWNDPRSKSFDFWPNIRGAQSRLFGRAAFDAFSDNLGVSLMIRAHEAYPEGIKEFFDGRLVSVFSTSYSGRCQPKILNVETDLEYSPIPIL